MKTGAATVAGAPAPLFLPQSMVNSIISLATVCEHLRRLFLKFFRILILITGVSAFSQPGQGFGSQISLVISASQSLVPIGGKIKVKLEITNTSSNGITLVGEHAGFEMEVRGPGGDLIPQKESFRRSKYFSSMLAASALAPGETKKWNFLVNDMYDIAQPGEYSVQIHGQPTGLSAPVKSNVIKVAIAAPGQAPTEAAPHAAFSLEIDTPQDIVKVGSRLEVVIEATNTTDHDIELNNALTKYSIDVRDKQGVAPVSTEIGQQLQKAFGREGSKKVRLEPGATGSLGSMILSDLYNLAQPGEYTMQVSRTDEETKTLVKSNVITITVNP